MRYGWRCYATVSTHSYIPPNARKPYLLPHFPPQEPMTALHVAAPQQEAATLQTWPC